MAKRAGGEQPAAKEVALKGWQAISVFLGEPVSVVQRWAKEGMPVRRESRSIVSSSEELNKWMGEQSGKPVHVATGTKDLSQELKRGLSFVRHEKSEARETSGKQSGLKARPA